MALARIQQDAGNQEAGENEEEVNAEPAGLVEAGKYPRGRRDRSVHGQIRRQSMEEDHRENGHSAQDIQPRHLLLEQ